MFEGVFVLLCAGLIYFGFSLIVNFWFLNQRIKDVSRAFTIMTDVLLSYRSKRTRLSNSQNYNESGCRSDDDVLDRSISTGKRFKEWDGVPNAVKVSGAANEAQNIAAPITAFPKKRRSNEEMRPCPNDALDTSYTSLRLNDLGNRLGVDMTQVTLFSRAQVEEILQTQYLYLLELHTEGLQEQFNQFSVFNRDYISRHWSRTCSGADYVS